jgi:hypothetical protein
MATAEDMTISQYGRGICPVCARSISLTKAGVIRVHGRERDTGQRFAYCRGGGEPPKET